MADILHAIDSALSEHDRLKSSIEEEHTASSVDAALQPDPTYHRYECPHPGCDWVRVALDLDVFDGLLAEHERAVHAAKARPWWRPRWWR